MPRYGEEYDMPRGVNQQRDLSLFSNEFCFILNKTNSMIKTYCGPQTVTISAQEVLVIFDSRTKKFVETSNFETAKQLFTSAPEGWYVELKNPAEGYPEAGKSCNIPTDIKIGRKINIPGPVSFALYPGQMTKIIQGHKLRSNQYLLARVYDAEAANKSRATIIDAEGKEAKTNEKYFVGQLLVIKGTEVSFYIPPTGIEVLGKGMHGKAEKGDYIREAVTLERLEYAILKDEDGEKRYVHGPAVVFPNPTETFVTAPKGGVIFRALELSPISGIYIKVIADYTDEKGVKHPTGEELFITGNDQMIYYPRPEHAMIQYDGKYMHHAIAIPEGEGRYILNRLTGDVTTVVGPKMYLPDPRTEVVVKRKLTEKECSLIYPGNREILTYNMELTEKAIEKLSRKGGDAVTNAINNAYSTSNQESALAIFEATSNISRGVSYTKPRTITLDTKFDGVVGVNIWTGYAVNIVSKTGESEIVVGPAARLLNYDETLEAVELSTGCPKTTDNLLKTGYLKVENNKVSDMIEAQTKDFVEVRVKVSYCVNFLPDFKDKWFKVENYVKYLCDRQRSLIKREIKKYTIEEFYANATDIVRNIAINYNPDAEQPESKIPAGRFFPENGMLVHDTEVLNVGVERKIALILEQHEEEMVRQCLELSDAEKKAEVQAQLAEYERQEIELKHANEVHRMELDKQYRLDELAKQANYDAELRAQKEAATQAEADLQKTIDMIEAAKLARARKSDDEKLATEEKLAVIEKAKQEAYAEMVTKIMASIGPDLVAALTTSANADMLETVTEAVGPYAIAKGESVADFTNRLLRGTSLEGIIEKATQK